MPLLIFRGTNQFKYWNRHKINFSPVLPVNTSSAEESVFEATGVICRKLLSSIISINIINKLCIAPSLKRRIKVLDGHIEQDFFDLQLKARDKSFTARLKVIPAIIPAADIHFILGQDYLKLMNEQPDINRFFNRRLLLQPANALG